MGCVRVCAVLARAGALCFAPDVEKNTKFKPRGDAAHNDQAPEPLGSNRRCAEEREPERERADVARERDNPPRGDVQLERAEAGAAATLAQRHEQSPPRNVVRRATALARSARSEAATAAAADLASAAAALRSWSSRRHRTRQRIRTSPSQ